MFDMKKVKASCMKVADLPDDIITEILLRLESKPLGRFKSVCKSWYREISSTEFTVRRRAKKLIFRIRYPNRYAIADYNKCDQALDIKSDDMGNMWNSCYGLLLVEQRPRKTAPYKWDSSNFVWNPTTGERQLLPEPLTKVEAPIVTEILHRGGVHKSIYDTKILNGLGYDHKSGFYRVLRVLYFHSYCCEDDCSEDCGAPDSEWSLYTQETNSWRRLSKETNSWRRLSNAVHPSKPEPYSYQMVYLENALHMVANTLHSEPDERRMILAFDLGSEKLREVPQPDHGDKKFTIDVNASHCWLSLVSHLLGPVVNVWVMKEYGNRGSWIKMFSINQSILTAPRCRKSLYLLHLSESGEVLASLGDRHWDDYLVSCDSITKKANIFKPLRHTVDVNTSMFVESLGTFDIDKTIVMDVDEEEEKEEEMRFKNLVRRKWTHTSLDSDYLFSLHSTISDSVIA